jgi:hypothetical protein
MPKLHSCTLCTWNFSRFRILHAEHKQRWRLWVRLIVSRGKCPVGRRIKAETQCGNMLRLAISWMQGLRVYPRAPHTHSRAKGTQHDYPEYYLHLAPIFYSHVSHSWIQSLWSYLHSCNVLCAPCIEECSQVRTMCLGQVQKGSLVLIRTPLARLLPTITFDFFSFF